MKKSYETPEFEFIEIGEIDCIMTSGLAKNQIFDDSEGSIDFGVFGQKN